MMAGYHSKIKNVHYRKIGTLAILTFKTNVKGPISLCLDDDLTEPTKFCPDKMDIIEESIYYFRANVFLSKFEINNSIDRLLVYLTLYILECLKKIKKSCVIKKQAQLTLLNFASNEIWTSNNSVLNFIYKNPDNPVEADYLKSYLYQIREESGQRICNHVFVDEKSKPSKWWMCFAKRKFLNLNLEL